MSEEVIQVLAQKQLCDMDFHISPQLPCSGIILVEELEVKSNDCNIAVLNKEIEKQKERNKELENKYTEKQTAKSGEEKQKLNIIQDINVLKVSFKTSPVRVFPRLVKSRGNNKNWGLRVLKCKIRTFTPPLTHF